MKTHEITWKAFKDLIEKHIEQKLGARMCRGQSDASWKLITSLHRANPKVEFKEYFEAVPVLADWVSSVINKPLDVSDPHQMGSFLAYVQHHGFPTPLLDWSLSPYIAAYFAFSEINEEMPQSENCAIYVFKHLNWMEKWKPSYNYDDPDKHVSVLRPKVFGNLRQLQQQGLLYMFTNTLDIESHIIAHEKSIGIDYLEKFIFSVKEKAFVMRDLESMGINAFSLFGGLDGLCRYFKDSLFRKDVIGKTPSERLSEFFKVDKS